MSTQQPNKDSKEAESQQKNGLRFFWIGYLIVLIACAVLTAFRPTTPRFVGLVILGAFTATSCLLGRASLRSQGFAILGIACLFAVIAEVAGPKWDLEWDEFAVMAITIGVFGLGMVLTDNRTGDIDPRFEGAVGWCALTGLIGIAGALVWLGPGLIARPSGLVVVEAVAALADTTTAKWKTHLSLVSLIPIALIIGGFVYPEWQPQISLGVRSALVFFVAHNHTWMIFPVVSAFGATALQAYNLKAGGKASVRLGLSMAGAVWLLLFVVDAS